ncbi:hypothetical protein DESPIG_02146 [Desulfovibrio piger ATCC 29098]|uniref:Uncharacterized protein n=1 Tax=Desulfovibrio piger ATCC 29098 TaxID=411464 RepID=B6WVM8_9BACT|nr:hypothetical protein DESPIG_02146 [Desulfovibrio piger ATCC 29098]
MGSLSTGQAPFFYAFFPPSLLPKGRDLPKHGLRGPYCRHAGRAGERPRPEGPASQALRAGKDAVRCEKAGRSGGSPLRSGQASGTGSRWPRRFPEDVDAARRIPDGSGHRHTGRRLVVRLDVPPPAVRRRSGKRLKFDFIH